METVYFKRFSKVRVSHPCSFSSLYSPYDLRKEGKWIEMTAKLSGNKAQDHCRLCLRTVEAPRTFFLLI